LKEVLIKRVDYASVLGEARAFVSPGLERVQGIMETVAQGAPGRLSGYFKDLLTKRGKRIRSTFLLLLAQTGRNFDLERAARVCAAVELIHLGSLIHDDIIDGSDLRRNEKTAHQRWGNRMAVLLGDFALAKAMELIWNDPDTRIPLSLCRASSRLIKAEVLEVDRAGRKDLSASEYLDIIEGKTAALLEACGECGAILAGHDPADIRMGATLGRDFGIAFQIIDDLLDFGFGAEQLDKRTFSDVRNGFLTLPLILFFADCAPPERRRMEELLENAGQESRQTEIRLLLEKHSAFQKARDMAVARVQAGLPFLESLPETPAARHLRQLCTLMTERSA
jgi:geranylgeranyl pyrophosphate synthase